MAVLLTKRGAHVSIVARNEGRLQKALKQLEVRRCVPHRAFSSAQMKPSPHYHQAARQSPDQILKYYSFSLDSEAGATAAIDAASEAHGGRSPDAFFFCAGKSTPGFFVEQDEASMRKGMDETYWAQAPSALVRAQGLTVPCRCSCRNTQAASKRMVSRHEKGKLVFVASVLGYFSIVGYSPYSPGKFAIRGTPQQPPPSHLYLTWRPPKVWRKPCSRNLFYMTLTSILHSLVLSSVRAWRRRTG